MHTLVSSKRAILCLLLFGALFLSVPYLSAAGNFTISASPSSLTIGQGNFGSSTITTTISGGFNNAISLSASGVPLGVSVGFNPLIIAAPGAGSSTMTVSVAKIAVRGQYSFTVTGNGGGIKHTVTINLTITFPGDFTISASPSSLSVPQGNQGASTITTAAFGGFGTSISLSYSGAPSGTTVAFNPQTIPAPGSGSSTMTITVGSSTPTGTYPITVTGTGGGIQHNTTVTLTVTPKQQPDFSISASPSSLSVAQGNQGTSTITTTVSGGFNSSISLSYSGAPTGTTVAFNPQTIPAPGSGSSTMTITVGSSTPTGTYPIVVTGNGGGIQHNVTVTLTVTGAANFTISASPASLSISQGNQGSSTITTTISGGFNSSIALSVTGTPTNTTINFNPQTIPAPGAGSSTMTINVGSTTPTGTYPLTVTGNGGGIRQTTTVTLTVTTPGQGPPNAKFEESYSYNLTASFGKPPYTYQLVAGSLPPGITLSTSGLLSGKATAVSAYNFAVQVTDSQGQKQTFNYTLTVLVGLDTYSGLTAAPVPGCTQTGYFQTVKASGRWVYATPLCNAFYQASVYDADFQFILQQIMQQRYNNDLDVWATHSLERMQFYGFNSIDIFASGYVLPVGTWGRKTGASIQLPFALYYSALNDVIFHPTDLGIPEPIKDICQGQDDYGFHGYCGYTLDVFDPKWQTANTGELANQLKTYTGGFNTDPWIIGVSLGDSANVNILTGGGTSQYGAGIYPHPAFVIATDNFSYSGSWQDPLLHSKYSWVSYLQNKYKTIAALNAAWSTGGFYTAFGDAGGFGSGTGVLDEDGRHTNWLGSDFYLLTGMNSNLQADLNQFLYNYAYQAYGVQASTIRTYDTNHLFICGTFGGAGDAGARPVVLQALRDAGCNVFVWNWNSDYPSYALANNQAEYDTVGAPAVLWYGVTAQADSDYSNYPKNGSYWGDYPTQQIRGQHYASDQQAIFNSRGTNGDYYIMGTAFWSLTDNTSEKTNWGLLSLSDNAYDGKCAVIQQSTDQWGFPCGGESANYGDFLDQVTQANSNNLQQLILQLLP